MIDNNEQNQISLDQLQGDGSEPDETSIDELMAQLHYAQEKIYSLEKQLEQNTVKQIDLMHESVNTIIENEQTKLHAAMEYLPEGLIILDPLGKIEKANTAARKLLTFNDHAPLDLIERAMDTLGVRDLITMNINSQQNKQGDFRFRSKNEKMLQIRWQVMSDNNGKQLGAVLIIKDMTDALADQKAKSDFIAAISHELRTPLTSIQNAVSNMLAGVTGRINTKTTNYLNTINSDCRRYATLISDLLDTSKLETGSMPLNRSTTSTETIANKALGAFQNIAEDKGVNLIAKLGRTVPPILADPQRIEQVMANLLDNAIKYAPKDSNVTLAVHETTNSVIITVTDNGTGIPKNIQSCIFDKFYQHNRQAGAGYRGVGLGLTICREIVKAHGGSIWLESELGNGSTFSFSIPKVAPAIILNKHLNKLSDTVGSAKESITLIMLKFQCPEENSDQFNTNAKSIIEHLLEEYSLYMTDKRDLAMRIDDFEMALIILDDKNKKTKSIIRKIKKNICNIDNINFGQHLLLPMMAVATFPDDTDNPKKLTRAARQKYQDMI